MPKITAFMKRLDPGRISTIVISPTNVERHEQLRRKLAPAPKGGSAQLFVDDCRSHTLGVDASIPVVLMQPGRVGAPGWKELGVARCCPLCWMILQTPEGVELPDPKPLVAPEAVKKPVQPPKERKAKDPASFAGNLAAIWQAIQSLKGTTFSTYDVMAACGRPRPEVRRRLEIFVKSGVLERTPPKRGRQNIAQYWFKNSLKKEKTDPNSDN